MQYKYKCESVYMNGEVKIAREVASSDTVLGNSFGNHISGR